MEHVFVSVRVLTSRRARTQSPPPPLPKHEFPTSPPLAPLRNTQSPVPVDGPFTLDYPTDAGLHHTKEWTNEVPFSSSPPSAPSIGPSLSSSPPYLQSGYGDRGRGGPRSLNATTPSTSPPSVGARLQSQVNGYQSFGDPFHTVPDMNRRASMYSPNQHPLPHQIQPHFYSAPNVDLGFTNARQVEGRPGFNSYYRGFDSLATYNHEGSRLVETVLLLGKQGALDILKVGTEKLESVGSLTGLRGGVYDAKILHWAVEHEALKSNWPLIVVVIHGPLIPEATTAEESPTTTCQETPTLQHPSPQTIGSPVRPPPRTEVPRLREITHYQTTVEVYSLRTQEYITTLLTCQASALLTSTSSPLFSPPQPSSNLKLDVSGRFITVTSENSGEVFIFRIRDECAETQMEAFACIGKTWTSLQTSSRHDAVGSPNSSMSEQPYGDPESKPTTSGLPLLSLSHRWLAIVPPSTSSLSSINATVLMSESNSKPAGLDTHAAPSQPQLTCSIESPEAESLFNKVAREVTQEVIKGARWVSDQSVQAWNNYFAKPQDTNATTDLLRRQVDIRNTMPQQTQPYFPPTHAYEDPRAQSAKDRTVVSILDLEQLARTLDTRPVAGPAPIATFQPPYGCSYVSFTPSGLMLLTASRKGDVQFVWDLMRITHGKGDTAGGQELINQPGVASDLRGPLVRQVARFARMTVASIMDVVWSSPRGDRLALLTENGTAHLFELPSSAFVWPPPRRSIRPATAPGSVTSRETDHESVIDDKPSTNAFTSAINMVSGKTQPLLAAVRHRPPSFNIPFSAIGGLGVTSAVGAKGGKAVAAGISKSVGAASGTVKTFRHAGENRVHLPGSTQDRTAGTVCWMNGREQGHLAVVRGGLLRIYSVVHSTSNKKGAPRYPTLTTRRLTELALPAVPDEMIAPAVKAYLQADGDGHHPTFVPGGYWLLQPISTCARKMSKPSPHPLSFAEIETNPPYQPFHTDPRVKLFIHNDLQPPAVSNETPWAFGEDIPATKVDLGSITLDDGDNTGDGNDQGRMENVTTFRKQGDDGIEQVVVTTRRRRARGVVDEGEFFEDDCEVVDFATDRV